MKAGEGVCNVASCLWKADENVGGWRARRHRPSMSRVEVVGVIIGTWEARGAQNGGRRACWHGMKNIVRLIAQAYPRNAAWGARDQRSNSPVRYVSAGRHASRAAR